MIAKKAQQIIGNTIFVAAAFFTTGALATDQYPSRPITYIMSSAAGTGPDALVRMVLTEVGTLLNTSFVVENRPSAGGVVGLQALTRAKPDGYTIGHGNIQTLALYPALTPNSVKFFNQSQGIAPLGSSTAVLAVNIKSKSKTLADFIGIAKAANPELLFGTPGPGSSSHIGTELFMSMSNLKMLHVPHKGAAAAATALMGDHVDVVLDNIGSLLSAIESKQLHPLAVTSKKRNSQLPNVPTLAESGFPDYELIAWSGVIGPKGIPLEVIKRLNDAINQVLKEPSMVKKLRDIGYEPMLGNPIEFQSWIEREQDKWKAVISKSLEK